MKKMALLLTVLMLSTVFVSCSSKSADPGTAASPAASEATGTESVEPTDTNSVENRIVVTNISGAASTSNPYAHSNLNDRVWQGNVFEPLFSYNGTSDEYEPRVGKTYEISEDGLVYTITIHDNVYFHNGDQCTAEDIKYSLEYAKTSPYNTVYSGCIDTVEVVDDYTVKINLSYANAAFLHNNDRIFIINKNIVEEQGDAFGTKVNLAGTGAYYMDYYDPAVEIRLIKFDDYYRDGVTIPGVTYKIMTDTSSALIAFEAGELDFVNDMPASSFAAIKDGGLYNTYIGQTPQLINIFVNNHRNEVLGNKLVRQAMAYAVNYDAVNIAGLEGYASTDGKLMYQPLTIAAPEGGIVYTHNPEKAKELLKEAGYEDGVDIGPILAIAGIYHEKVAQVLQANFAEVGITSTVETMEQVTCITEMRNANYGLGVMGTYHMLDFDYLSTQIDYVNEATTMVKIRNSEDFDWERIHELFEAGRSVTDVEKRLEYYTELDDILMDACVSIPLFHTALPYAWNKNLVINTDKSYTYQYTHLWDAHWE